MIEITDKAFNPATTLGQFQAAAEGAGGVVSFTGLVRPEASGQGVKTLTLQAYDPLTRQGIEAAVTTAHGRWPLTAVHIIHRIGEMLPGEAIVFVATASAHRRAAFEAADFLMDYLKTEAMFWKKETGSDGQSVWIEPRQDDYEDAARWARQE